MSRPVGGQTFGVSRKSLGPCVIVFRTPNVHRTGYLLFDFPSTIGLSIGHRLEPPLYVGLAAGCLTLELSPHDEAVVGRRLEPTPSNALSTGRPLEAPTVDAYAVNKRCKMTTST